MQVKSGDSKTTTNHEEIRKWVDARKGWPSYVADTADESGSAVLRIDFQDPDPGLKRMTWEQFFEIFDRNKLAFLYQDKTVDGGLSRFHKFVNR